MAGRAVVLSPVLVSTTLLGALMGGETGGVMPPWAWAVWGGVLILANPILEHILTTMIVGYEPFDSTPGEGMTSRGAFVAAGLLVLGGLARSAVGRRVPAQR